MLLKVAVFYSLWLLLFSCPIMSSSLQPLELQHARLLCPSPSPEVCPSSCPLHWWCHPATSSSDALFSFCLQSFPASGTFQMSQLFTSIRWPKYWCFSFSFSPSDEFSELISLKIDWFVLLAVQETLRSFLQHHSLKAPILQCSAFLTVQLSQPYVTSGKTIALTVRTFVGRIISLLFSTLSRFVIAFLPICKYLLISWLQWPFTVILFLFFIFLYFFHIFFFLL